MPINDNATHLLSVPDISCDHCKTSIEEAVGALDDVERVEVDIERKTVAVVGGGYDRVVAAIDDAGFDVA